MMLRYASQVATLVINFLIIAIAVWIIIVDYKSWPVQAKWIMYGIVGGGFYVIVVLFGNGNFGNDYSPIRTLIQDTLVLVAVFFALVEVIRRKHG